MCQKFNERKETKGTDLHKRIELSSDSFDGAKRGKKKCLLINNLHFAWDKKQHSTNNDKFRCNGDQQKKVKNKKFEQIQDPHSKES